MNPVAEDILRYIGCNEWDEERLAHYGMPRRSGRYPYGSGENPYQHGKDFLSRVEELKKNGWEETPENIMKEFGLKTSQYRIEKKICNDERKLYKIARIKSLQKDGLGPTEIGKIMGINESSVRSALKDSVELNTKKARETADFLKKQIDEKGMIDVSGGTERDLNISKEMLKTSLYLLEKEGYPIYKGGIPQVTNPGMNINQTVICKPGTKHKEIYEFDKVHSINEDNFISRDGGKTFEKKFNYPESLDSNRLMIRYNEEGGLEKDGVIELRRNVPDLDLGESRYSQVRIMVDGTHYLKGMAVYSDNMPDGVDVIFNTNKPKGTPKLKTLKTINDDPENPFGSLIKDADQGGQYWYDAKTGKRCSANDPNVENKKLGLINKRATEGDWADWSNALPSQFLSKQSLTLAEKQLDLAKKDRLAEYEDICSINNPTIKKYYLKDFADGCDAAAVYLKAAALPGQKYHVILPVNSLKQNEVFAPNYDNGTKLALIRYPHGGTFEIPILTVNNKNKEALKVIGNESEDAVGIHSKVAERLSGADFDGDTVMCIPTDDPHGRVKIKSTPALKDLEGFDPKLAYPEREGMTYLSKKNKGTEMGKISNLITDMTLGGAKPEELARAVKHSMVVIDAEKHKLDYKQSEIDNNISALNKKYRSYIDEDGNVRYSTGASTIISRAKGEYDVPKRQGSPKVNLKGKEWYDPTKPEGSLIYNTADPDKLYKPIKSENKKKNTVTYITLDGEKITYNKDDKDAVEKYSPIKIKNPDGSVKFTSRDGSLTYSMEQKTQKSTQMAETEDARTLVSAAKHPMELKYAEYANFMKDLARRARIEEGGTGKVAYSPAARKKYAEEVSSLNKKINDAEANRSKERAAQRMANAAVKAKKESNPNMSYEDIKKENQRAITKYREEVGSISRRKRNIDITDREWEAIQAGAISENQLLKILNNTDASKLRDLATPKTRKSLTSTQISRVKALASSNYTLNEIAKKLGVSTTTVSKCLKGQL